MAKSEKSQIQKFRDTARALECDESAMNFDAALGKIARAKVPADKELAALARAAGHGDPNKNFGKPTKKR